MFRELLNRGRSPGRAACFGRVAIASWALAFAACKGDDGDDGRDGQDGTNAVPPTSTDLQPWEDPPGVVLTVTALSGGTGANDAFLAGDTITVRFTAKKDDGSDWMLSELSSGHIMVAGPTFNYQLVIDDQSDLLTAATDNEDGTWSYTFATPIPSTYLPPINDTPAFDADDGELQGQALLDGTYTVGLWCRWEYFVGSEEFRNVGQTTAEFLLGAPSTLTAREVVKTENCNQCHTTIQAHGGSRRTVQICILCHTSGAEDSSGNGVSVDFRVMIHKLHQGAHLPSVNGVATNPDGSRNYAATPTPYEVGGTDYSTVAFPVFPNLTTSMPRDAGYSALTSGEKSLENILLKGATECSKCHGDPDSTGPLTPPAQGDLHRSQPTRRACGSCHDDIDWTLPYTSNLSTMPPQLNDSACLFCHVPTGASALSTETAHIHPINDPAINAGVNFDITAMGGASGGSGSFQPGDKPTITFTLKDDAGADVPLASLDSTSTILVGPTDNYQHVFPFATPNGASSGLPVDFSGRLQSSSSSGKGSMSKVVDATVTETLVVQFVSFTTFTVNGTTSGLLGSTSLASSTSTNPSGSSLGTLLLTSAAVPQTIAVTFGTSTAYSVTGSVSGAMGSGTMPAATSASTEFTSNDGTVSFILSSGSTPFAAGNTIHLVVFRGSAANPVLFGLVAGTTSFALNDRFHYDTVATAATYTFALPMDIPTEFLGDGDGNPGQSLTAANVPVYFGRQTLLERTALVGASTTLAAASLERDRYVDVALLDAGLAIGDYAVLDNGVAGLEEYALIGFIDTALQRVWFRTPLRFAHTPGSSFQEATLSSRQEGVHYTLTASTGTITSIGGFGSGNAVVLSYRTDGAFGWLRSVGDTLQSVFVPPINDSPDLEQSWGEWAGLALVDGTYSASIWGRKNTVLGRQNEVQTYNGIGEASIFDFLFGAAATLEPYSVISAGENCNACHTMVGPFHGGNRRDFNTCILCHGVAGDEDWPIYGTTVATQPTTGVTINFRTMLHKIHQGRELFDAANYVVLGNSSSEHTYEHVGFPAMPRGTQECTKCHGDSDQWRDPGARQHPSQTTPTRAWRAACGACHDSPSATGHIDVNTSSNGVESCAVCHGEGEELAVELVHKVR